MPQRARPWLRPVLAAALLLVASGCTEDGSGEPLPEVGDDTLVVTGQDDLTWDVEQLSAPAGEIEFLLVCEDQVAHDLVIDETGERVATCPRDGHGLGKVELGPGSYTYYCSIPGHERTMRGTLEVE
jgi:plastocyanin